MARFCDWLDRWRRALPRREGGQGLIEYGLIISVVSIAAVVLIMAIGPKVASMFSTAGASAFPSDRRRKANFASVDRRQTLARVAALPVQDWSALTPGRTVRHIGPPARDFQDAFGTGDDAGHIALVDANGVALAAIQGLHEHVQDHGTQLKLLEARLAELEQRGLASRPAIGVTRQR